MKPALEKRTVWEQLFTKSPRTTLLVLLLGLPLSVFAQETAAYVSRLTAQPGPTSVLLTWKDAPGWTGVQYEIWRSDKEIVKDSLAQAKLLAVVEAGKEAYEDTTAVGPSFYLVLMKDTSGTRRSFYVPYRNKTVVAVNQEGTAAKTTARVKVGSVSYANPQVLIPFTAFPADRKLVVFRRSSPITTWADLKDATTLGNVTAAQSPYRDTPAPGLEFYYAIVDAQAYADGKEDAFQPENATDLPAGFPLVSVPAERADANVDVALRPAIGPSSRALPLPLLQFDQDPGTGTPVAGTAFEPIDPRPLPPQAEATLKNWTKTSAPASIALPDPIVLPEERSGNQTGTGRYLVQIQKAYLEPKDWKGALTALDSVLKLSQEPRPLARTLFYRGEARAYLKDYRGAFLDFLSARDEYPAETSAFLEPLFNLLKEETD